VLAGAVFIGYVLYGPLGGASTDRLGVRRGILLSAVIVTVASLLRSESVGFVDFLAYSSLFSVGIVMQIAWITRQIFEWFPSRRGYVRRANRFGFLAPADPDLDGANGGRADRRPSLVGGDNRNGPPPLAIRPSGAPTTGHPCHVTGAGSLGLLPGEFVVAVD